MLSSLTTLGQDLPPKNDAREIPATQEQINSSIDSLSRKQENPTPNTILQDSVKITTDSILPRKETLTDKVTYKAKDYERISQRLKKIFLYNEAEVIYEDMKINAGEIILDYETNTVFAKGVKDSAGVYSQIPVFVQGPNEVQPDSIKFNFKTQRAIIYGSRVEQAGGQQINLKAERSKRVNDSVVFMGNVKITTSKNLDDPEYYFLARRVKFVPGKKLVAGLTNMYIADVPTPIGLPFAYIPMEKEESVSGFIPPGFQDSSQRGYALTDGGYFFSISDYFNLTLQGDYFTNGSYGFRADSEYKLRYKFNGRFRFSNERILASERGLPDFSETNTYNINWQHSQDTKSSPNSQFSASVNLGSSNFFTRSLNQANTGNFLTNNFSSSISYRKTFPGNTPINLVVAATHQQNTGTGIVNMTLPSAQLNVDRIYLFANKSGSKKGLIQNVNFNYSVRGDNRYITNDDDFFTAEMFKNGNSGIQHSVPLTTNFKLFKYISTSVGGNFEENWVFKTIDRRYDEQAEEEVTDTINGFDAFRTYSANVSLGTTIYGTFIFKPESRIEAIRHTVRPSVSWGYRPAFDQFYDSYLRPDPTDPTATELTDEVEFSRFENGFFSAPGRNISNTLSFAVTNNFEAKVKSKDSTATEPKKVALLKNLNFRTSYNIAADTLKLAPIAISGAIPIIDGKLDINFSGAIDLYAIDSNNRRFDRLNINNGGSLFRLTQARANFGYSFSSKDFEKKNGDGENTDRTENKTFAQGGRPDDLLGQGVDIRGNNGLNNDDAKDGEEREVKFYNFKIPWSLRFGYQVGYSNNARQSEISTHSLVVSGDVELGNRWKIGGSSGYDFANPGITFTTLNFTRDLESWTMRFSWVPPVNANTTRTSWNFFIGISGSLLKDIKYDKNRRPDERL